MEKNNDTIEIDLREVFAVLMQKLWLIAITAAVVATAAFCVSRLIITPTYESTTRIVILTKQNNSGSLQYSDLQLGSQLTKDYPELITSRYVVEQVLARFEMDISYKEFLKKVDVSNPTDTRIIDITVTNPDPVLAKELADEMRNVAADRIREVMDIEAVNVVDEGNIAEEPANPNVLMWTLMGFLIGAFLAAALVLIRFLMDDTIKSSEDIERYLNLSTLALIPISEEEEERGDRSRRRQRTARDKQIRGADEGGIEVTDLENV